VKPDDRLELVIDACTWIAFENCGGIKSLDAIRTRIVVTQGVASETGVADEEGKVRGHGWATLGTPTTPARAMLEGLTLGERDCIHYCMEGADWRFFVSHDRRAKRDAASLGVHVLDTTAMLLLAWSAGRLPADALRRVAMYVAGVVPLDPR
jgi:predicted nucleic acid-binding protein